MEVRSSTLRGTTSTPNGAPNETCFGGESGGNEDFNDDFRQSVSEFAEREGD